MIRRRRATRQPGDVRLFALLSFRDEMRYLPGWFAANAHQVDATIAYDDGSTDGSAEFVANQPGVVELLHRPTSAPAGWDQPAIHRALVDAAGRHHADWLIAVDADERMEETFGTRARAEVIRLERRGIRAAAVGVHELWDAPDRYRVDGVWGGRWRSRLFAWRPDAEHDPRPQHSHWAPLNSMTKGGFPPVDAYLYHLRMIHPADRELRRIRCEAADPDRAFQPRGYAYLTDPAGIELAAPTPGRGYSPLHVDPELAVVVLSMGNPPELSGAVRSVLDQGTGVELVVVNTGGGQAAQVAGPLGARTIEVPDGRFAGGARNLGIAATRAPFISFLAADCRAEPGWVDARLAAHRAGSRAVASAVTNAHPRSLPAWASHLLVFGRRLPGLPRSQALRYGVSYDRVLFDQFGTFREDLRSGEDTELHSRWTSAVPIDWVPRVRTAHLNPTSVRDLLADQRARGARGARTWAQLDGGGSATVVRGVLLGAGLDVVRAFRVAEPGQRRWLAGATVLLPAALAAYAGGMLRQRRM